MLASLLRFIPGLYLGWGLGSNDAANVFGPQVNVETIRYRDAVLLSAVLILIGAVAEGRSGFATIGGISDIALTAAFVAALGAAVTVNVMTFLRLPVSTTQAIVGSIIGISLLQGNPVDYSRLVKIFVSWVMTPVGAAIISFITYKLLALTWHRHTKNLLTFNFTVKILSIIIGCYAAYSLGANNVANVMGVFVGAKMISPFWATVLGGASIATGVLTYSRKVMYTVGKDIAPLDPFSALIVVLSEALTLHIFTQIGIPVSSSQAVVGAVVGVGLVKETKTVNGRTLINIFVGWILTVVGAAGTASVISLIVRLF